MYFSVTRGLDLLRMQIQVLEGSVAMTGFIFPKTSLVEGVEGAKSRDRRSRQGTHASVSEEKSQ